MKSSYVNIFETTVLCASAVTEKKCSGIVPMWTISSNLLLTGFFILFSITCCSSWAVSFHSCSMLASFLQCLILVSIPVASGSAEDLW